MKKIILWSFGVLLLALAAGLGAAFFIGKNAETMGTKFHFKGEGRMIALAEIKRLEKLFDKFAPSSEVSLLNLAAGKRPVKVSPDTYRVVREALLVSSLSGGAFDITLGKNGTYRDILLDPEGRWVFLRNSGMAIDLGGVGKGYAVEAARQKLREKNIGRALIDLGSSLAAIGGPWRIGVRDPFDREKLIGAIELKDGEAVSTSGNYERGEHIVDPTGQPGSGEVVAVTLVGRDAGLLDALSTAVFVLGTAEGLALIDGQAGLKGVIIDRQRKIWRSKDLVIIK